MPVIIENGEEMSRVPTLTVNGRRQLAAISTAAATALATALVVPAAAHAEDGGTPERVLQSVSMQMSSDGSLTGVDGSVVRTAGSAEDADTSQESYAPADVVADLPVRVLTTWRTADGAGTDLSDLEGYDGRVAIDLTVQNLTVRPQLLSYDVAGSSRQQAALVGAPLTVTASTLLDDVKQAQVVTDHEGTGHNVTNGVLGKTADGTSIQWAALLAPPTLSSSAELSLVVDAKNFQVPTFDLSVQPGLVTDPSIGALVDSAFNPESSDELALQRRTIELIGQVNDVLARASSTISDVRTSLNDSADTLGSQTVTDLQASTQSVASNMRALDGALQNLRTDLSSTLKSTGSSAVAELDQAVAAVDKLLGDTSAQAPVAGVSGYGCQTTVAKPKQSGSVYGNLLQVASQLGGYAHATDDCKAALQASIEKTIGDPIPLGNGHPNDEAALKAFAADCARQSQGGESMSVTCSLYDTQDDFNKAAEQMRTDLKIALDLLKPELYDGALLAARKLINIANGDPEADPPLRGFQDITSDIDEKRTEMFQAAQAGYRALKPGGEVDRNLTTVENAVSSFRSEALGIRAELVGDEDPDTPQASENSVKAQAEAAASSVCELVVAGTLTPEEAEKTLSYLVPRADCFKRGLAPIDPFERPITERISPESPADDTGLADALDRGVAESDKALAALDSTREKTAELVTAFEKVAKYDGETDPAMQGLFTELLEKIGELEDQSVALKNQVVDIQALATRADKIDAQIDSAVDNAQTAVNEGVTDGSEDVYASGQDANEQLGTMFDRSSKGMRTAAADVVNQGKKSVDQQRSAFKKARNLSANQVSGVVEDGLAQINRGVSASTRDMEAATSLLTADLRKVLLDLGQRRVGGGGLLGSMATNAATANSADYQLSLAVGTTTSYANVRGRDIGGIMLRQEQTDAAMEMLARMPAFQLDLPAASQHRTVYTFRVGGEK